MKTSELFNIGTFSFIDGKDDDGFFHLINNDKIRLIFYNMNDPATYFNQPEEVLLEVYADDAILYHKKIKNFYTDNKDADLKEQLKYIEKLFSRMCYHYDLLPDDKIKEKIEDLVKEGDKIYIQLKSHI